MGIAARLSKLEEKAPRVLRCVWCRYVLTDTPAAEVDLTPEAGGYALKNCTFCGTEYRAQGRDRLSPREREALDLFEDQHDGETYRDERAYAAMEWWLMRRNARLIVEKEAERGEKPPAANLGDYGRGKKPEVKESKEAREFRERKERAQAFIRRVFDREEKLYGPRTFPLAARLEELKKEPNDFQLDGEKEFRSGKEKTALWALSFYERAAACELVLWGEVTAETRAEIERLAAEAERLAAERRAEKLEQEARRRREEEERQERYRREREERERERLERSRPPVGRAHWLHEYGVGGNETTATRYIPGEDKPDPYDSDYWSKAAERAKSGGGVVGMVYIPPEEAKPQPPPDDGTADYQRRLARWKQTGVWEPMPWDKGGARY